MSTETETKERSLQEIGQQAYSSILEMVNALECDYERLEELKDEKDGLVTEVKLYEEHTAEGDAARLALAEWEMENGEELADLTAQAGESESQEDARQRIEEDALSLEVRSGWVTVGEEMTAEEFNILLCTGGPAVRIVGELSNGEPSRAWLEVQDWFTPWTQYFGVTDPNDPGALIHQASQDVLLAYARCFYFGQG